MPEVNTTPYRVQPSDYVAGPRTPETPDFVSPPSTQQPQGKYAAAPPPNLGGYVVNLQEQGNTIINQIDDANAGKSTSIMKINTPTIELPEAKNNTEEKLSFLTNIENNDGGEDEDSVSVKKTINLN